MSKSPAMQKAMRIVWEGENEGSKFEDLWEYPYADWEREKILARLEATVKALFKAFPQGV